MQRALTITAKEPIVASGSLERGKFICPDCKDEVYLRRRANWTDHFCHKPNTKCSTRLAIATESDEHKLGKQFLAEKLTEQFKDDPTVEIVVEKFITLKSGSSREIDVAVIKDSKPVLAYECQLSPILIDGKHGLAERTMDYRQEGIEVVWWFGIESLTETVKEWCENSGKGYWLRLERAELSLEGYIMDSTEDLMESFLAKSGLRQVSHELMTIGQRDMQRGLDLVLKAIPFSTIKTCVEDTVKDYFEDDQFELAGELCLALRYYEKLLDPDSLARPKEDTELSDWFRYRSMIVYVLKDDVENKGLSFLKLSRKIQDTFLLKESDYLKVSTYAKESKSSRGCSFVCWRYFLLLQDALNELVDNGVLLTRTGFEENEKFEVAYSLGIQGHQLLKSINNDLSKLAFRERVTQEVF